MPNRQIEIPFNRPSLQGNEQAYMIEAVNRGHIAGDGLFTDRCHELLRRILGVQKALLTTSCTHALEMAALLLDIKAGDEVIVPSFTFVSTINAFVLRGAVPVFADIRPDTLNLDETQLEKLISSRTRVIVPVHYAGVACEMDTIMEIATQYRVDIVEDNAHGILGKYKGQYLGTFGCLATQSFHETKNFTCGEGGALLINDPKFNERAEIIREKGTDRSRFFRGEVDKYTWTDLGSSYLPSDALAGFLLAQLEMRDSIQSKRKHLWDSYYRQLNDWAIVNQVRLPVIPNDHQQPYHMFYMLLPSLAERQAFIEHLRAHGILSVFHYLPLHRSKMGRASSRGIFDCPVTDYVSDTIVRLPFFNDMSEKEQRKVIDTVLMYRTKASPQCTELSVCLSSDRR